EVGCDPGTATSRVRTIAPTLVVDVPDDSAIMADEIFGPLLPVRTYGDMDEVIGFVNSRPRPLALYYFGPDGAERAQLLARTTSRNVG
ncbi:aldehyde dehydrogenase family protein, partial [Klebsiella pneumoniae]|nr:aldehyde dehydrogenase family protein [Klebsiella pneumoniae]